MNSRTDATAEAQATVQDLLFDSAEFGAEPANAKDLRELLFAGLVTQLEADAADLDPGYNPDEYLRDADGGSRSGSGYWQAYQQACGIRMAFAAARSRLATHEEYAAADAERRRRTSTEAEQACARHRDVCPHCTSHTQDAWRAQRREDRLEQIRAIYVQGLHQIIHALGDPERTLTVAEVRKALQQVSDAGHRAWEKANALNHAEASS